MTTADELRARHCTPQTQALPEARVAALLALLDGWQREGKAIVRTFSFPYYAATLGFVNRIAPMIHEQDHHPELTVTYNRCTVRYWTHSVDGGQGGLSENDFICAARIDALYREAL
ncbi:putative pterin-4-alpha-carbinolamine dehydratase [Oxalicibacterium flavum]|uniref:Putative pterin-4-alpha-carbinolamine dehydratase n=1 Tax=Oxalicibacterium flavum TaxID=179467 RepID=A0A8J2UJG4_9BURK|nr:4a-hydroxytetrahydrobiopterin dehydratase [Oxalicibacterium flavum]GGB96004.1 putative pterin-4-alpha-carbinolamine dehydratase [Oxalicibacterium flavum]